MKILALEQAAGAAAPEDDAAILREEAAVLWELCRRGVVREAYFTPAHAAVLILELPSVPDAEAVLAGLPLVRAGLIRFQVTALLPYDGFARLFQGNQPG